jgi:hypothetical protein
MKGGNAFGMIPTYLRGHLTAYEMVVYIALTWRHGANGVIFPSHATIAEEAGGISVSSVKRALLSLREKELITWEPVKRPNGAQTSNRYTIHLRPPRSDRATPPFTGTDEVDTGEPDALKEAQNSVPSDKQTSSGPRDRGTKVFDADALVDELEDDSEALGFLANNNWFGDTTELVEAAFAELKANDAINNEGAWLAGALKHMTPVSKAARLLELVGEEA